MHNYEVQFHQPGCLTFDFALFSPGEGTTLIWKASMGPEVFSGVQNWLKLVANTF